MTEPQWEACKVCGGDHWTKDHDMQKHDEPVHERCQWCGICLQCQEALAKASKCGDGRKECKRAERFRHLNPHTTSP